MPEWDADTYAAHKRRLAAGLTAAGLALIERARRTPRGAVDGDTARLGIAAAHRSAVRGTGLRPATRIISCSRVGRVPTSEARRSSGCASMLAAPDSRAASGWARRTVTDGGQRWGCAGRGARGRARSPGARMRCREQWATGVRRVPAPFDADHPRADLLRRTGFQVRFVEALPTPSAPRHSSIGAPSASNRCFPSIAG